MKLAKMTKEELETLSYTDLTEMILNEKKKSLNTPSIFKEICGLLELSDDEYAAQIGDFYTSLTTDKRFVLLDNACWDLRDKHKIEIVLDDEEDDSTEESEEDDIEIDENDIEEDEDNLDSLDNDETIEQDDDLEDLTILDEDEIEE